MAHNIKDKGFTELKENFRTPARNYKVGFIGNRSIYWKNMNRILPIILILFFGFVQQGQAAVTAQSYDLSHHMTSLQMSKMANVEFYDQVDCQSNNSSCESTCTAVSCHFNIVLQNDFDHHFTLSNKTRQLLDIEKLSEGVENPIYHPPKYLS